MSELVTRAPAAESAREPRGSGGKRRARTRKALELVALRGKDVIGVRHLVDGGHAWIGNVPESLARVPMIEFGGKPIIVGEVHEDTFTLNLAPRARARLHGVDGMARLLVGPQKICLREGERAVLVLGAVQIRAQIATIEAAAHRFGLSAGAFGWVAFVIAVYMAALGLCVSLAPPASVPLQRGAVQRLVGRFLPDAR